MFEFLKSKETKQRERALERARREKELEAQISEYNKREWKTNDFRVFIKKDSKWTFLGFDLVFVREIDLTGKIITLSGIMPKCDRVLNSAYISGNIISIARGICADLSIYDEDNISFSFHGCRIVGQKIMFPRNDDRFDYVTRDIEISFMNNP